MFKSLILGISILSLSVVAFADVPAVKLSAKEVERKVKVIAGIAHGFEKHQVSAPSAEEMVLKLYMKSDNLTRKEALDSFRKNLPSKDISFGDMSGWGTLRLDAALDLFDSQDPDFEGTEADRIRHNKKLRMGGDIIRELSEAGIKFGYTDHSSSYCGVTFMGLLIVDQVNDTIYEIRLTGSSGC